MGREFSARSNLQASRKSHSQTRTKREVPLSGVGVVVIGRNEGQRLVRCVQSLATTGASVVYVDSGSTDGSVQRARELGAKVIELDRSIPFSASRARNTGLAALREIAELDF